MLKAEWLYYLNQVYRFNSIKYAAQSIPCSPSTISVALHKLEEEIGLPLLLRAYRGVELTETAQEIAKMSDDIFKCMDNINEYIDLQKQQLHRQEHQTLVANQKLTMHLNSGLYQGLAAVIYERVLSEFNIELNILESDWRMENILRGINDHRDTVSFGYFKEPFQEDTFADSYPNVRFIKLKTGRPSIFCHRDFFAGRTEVTSKEVLEMPFLRYTRGYEQAMTVFEMLEEYGKVNIVGNYPNVTVLTKALINKKGISVGINVLPEAININATEVELHYVPIRSDMRMTLAICYNIDILPYHFLTLKKLAYIF